VVFELANVGEAGIGIQGGREEREHARGFYEEGMTLGRV
jgi:hypothetical protein